MSSSSREPLDVFEVLQVGVGQPSGPEYTPSPSSQPGARSDQRDDPSPLKRSPAQNFALVIGWTLVIAGGVGFAYSGVLRAPRATSAIVFGLLGVNGWHNLVHLAHRSDRPGRVAGSYAGGPPLRVGLGDRLRRARDLGLRLGTRPVDPVVMPVNTEDNFLHALIALGPVRGRRCDLRPRRQPTAPSREPAPRLPRAADLAPEARRAPAGGLAHAAPAALNPRASRCRCL